jgi:hypothetical protein
VFHAEIMARFWPKFNSAQVKGIASLRRAIAAARRFNDEHIACPHIDFIRIGQYSFPKWAQRSKSIGRFGIIFKGLI